MIGAINACEVVFMPTTVRTYAHVLFALAIASAIAVSLTQPIGEVETSTVLVLAALTLALVAAATLPMSRAGGAGHLVTLEEAVLLAMLVAVPVGVLPWLVLLAVSLHEVRRRTPLAKLAFNVGVAGLGAAAAVAEVVLITGVLEAPTDLQRLGVAAFGVAVAATVQLVLYAVLLHLLEGSPVREHMALEGYLDVALVLNILLGVVLATAIVAEPAMAGVTVLLIAALGGLLRGHDDEDDETSSATDADAPA